MVYQGDLVMFDGSASSDADGDPLTYQWTITTAPEGSSASLVDAHLVAPTLVVDIPGTYVMSLVVNDTQIDSEVDTVSISTHPEICDTSSITSRQIPITLRDFKQSHPDFEYRIQEDFGIVSAFLGDDYLPVYANEYGNTPTTNGKEYFDQWFRNVDGVNIPFERSLEITREDEDSVWRFSDGDFFPLDNEGWGNTRGYLHNFYFTLEAHMEFLYEGGEVFTFRGDDDLWLYINGKLAIDIGGVHAMIERSVDLDEVAHELGIEKGSTYSFDLFFAERHTTESNFQFETNINLECTNGNR